MKKLLKRTLLATFSVTLLLCIVLVAHIYAVTKPRVDASTRVLARIDFKQDIDDKDANTIYAWLIKQVGVDRVVCNAANNNIVFSYAPAKADGDKIVNKLKGNLHYNAIRYMPNATDAQKGCPVSETSTSYKVYNYLKNIF